MAIFKELGSRIQLDQKTKMAYGCVVELQERLHETCQLAHEMLRRSKATQKQYYDHKAKARHVAVGDKVLLLLPSNNNKLILTWKGPVIITEKRSDSDFVIDLGTRQSTFHINLLKKYEESDLGDSPSPAEHQAAPLSARTNTVKSMILHLLY